jgi:4-aminobutyrate--pyruvate transaminase
MQRGNSAASRDIAYNLHPYTHLKKHESDGPLVITEGKGIHVYDENGKEYIEGLAGLWCTSLGFGEERLVEAATRQLKRLPYYHIFNHKSHDTAAELAERLIALMPVKMSKVFFNNSGSEANDTAVKMVWYFNNARGRHRKKKIIARMKGYHGVTVAAASLTGLPNNHRDFDLPIDNIRHADCPHHYRFAKPGESEEAFATRLAESLEAQILREDPETVAAFIAEPVMGAGGVIVPPKTYFEKIQGVLKKYDVLLIADEVICGFGRTGNMWGTQTYGLKPDIITMAKALSSAYLPISATVISEEIYQAFVAQSEKLGQFAHGFTYSGHPVCCAVGLRNVAIIEEEGLVERAGVMGKRLLAGLESLRDLPAVGDVRGIGMMGGVELVADRGTKAPAVGLGGRITREAMARGLLPRIRAGGADPAIGDTICVAPPLMTPEATIDRIPEILRAAIVAAT